MSVDGFESVGSDPAVRNGPARPPVCSEHLAIEYVDDASGERPEVAGVSAVVPDQSVERLLADVDRGASRTEGRDATRKVRRVERREVEGH